MKRGGVGGESTKTGLFFEGKVDLIYFISKQKGYTIKDDIDIYYKGKYVATSFKKHGLYAYLRGKGVDYKKYITKKLLPDDAIFVLRNNTFFILEIKFQEVQGSTDEKLQTCDFKIKQYRKLLSKLKPKVKVEYIYILNDWFKQDGYKDVLEYISSIKGCSYYFNELPLLKIGLPVSK